MHKQYLMRFLSMLLILSVVVLGIQISTPGKASDDPQSTLPQYTYLPIIDKLFEFENPFGVMLFTFDTPGGLAQFSDGKTKWSRGAFSWSTIEPTEGARQWNPWTDQQLVNAAAANITPIMLIDGTPTWALKPGYSCGAVAQAKFQALANFAHDLAERYSVAPYNVHYWELFNEPDAYNVLGCWGDPTDTKYYGGYYYGQMLQAVVPAIRQADPEAQVLVGGLVLDCDPNNPPPPPKDCTPAKFLNGILASGAGPSFDGVSFHAYDYTTGLGTYANPNWNSTSATTGPVLIAKANYLKGVLAQYGFSQKFLVNTETGVFYGPNRPDPPCALDAPAYIEPTKIYYMVENYAAAKAVNLKVNLWYAALGGRCAALLNPDLSPKPSYYAYQQTSQELGNAVFVQRLTQFPKVMGYEFLLDSKKLWVVWSLDNAQHSISLPSLPTKVFHLGTDGLAVVEPNTNPLVIDLSPRFVEFGP